jgi:hypothetical protein
MGNIVFVTPRPAAFVDAATKAADNVFTPDNPNVAPPLPANAAVSSTHVPAAELSPHRQRQQLQQDRSRSPPLLHHHHGGSSTDSHPQHVHVREAAAPAAIEVGRSPGPGLTLGLPPQHHQSPAVSRHSTRSSSSRLAQALAVGRTPHTPVVAPGRSPLMARAPAQRAPDAAGGNHGSSMPPQLQVAAAAGGVGSGSERAATVWGGDGALAGERSGRGLEAAYLGGAAGDDLDGEPLGQVADQHHGRQRSSGRRAAARLQVAQQWAAQQAVDGRTQSDG